MTALPSNADLTTVPSNHGLVRAALGNMRDMIAGVLGTTGTVATALATLGAFAGQYAALSGAYTVVAGDRGKAYSATGTWTLGLTAAATLGSGFSFFIINISSGTITIDPNSTEQINGATTLALTQGQAALLTCTGTAWYAATMTTTLTLQNLPSGWVKDAAKCASTANLALSGTSSIDGVTIAAGDRVLVKDQSAPEQNGIYIVAAGAWSRSTDTDAASEVAGSMVVVKRGTLNKGTRWATTFQGLDTVGTDWMSWYRVLDASRPVAVDNGGTGQGSGPAAIANLNGYTSIATAAGTTILTSASTVNQAFTGSTTQTVQLPAVSTLSLGWTFTIANKSTGVLSVASSDGSIICTLTTGQTARLIANASSGTSAAVWDYSIAGH